MKTAILRLLKEDDSYISGQQLCDRFQVSRTAVWKAVEQLKKEGYMIEAVRNKGYRLVDSPDVMSKAEIESMVRTKWAGRSVIYYDETDSTNIQAKLAGENGSEHGTLVVADRQVAGKGRRGRSWESPKGVCVYMTLLLRPSIAPVKAPMLTLVMALSVAEAVRELTGLKETFSEEIRKRATSLLIEGGRHISRSELVAAVMERYEENYERFMETKDLSGLQEKYNGMLVNCGREVRVLEPKGEYSAFASGINEVGELVVTTPEGEEKHIFAGEVSVRGIYGYV